MNSELPRNLNYSDVKPIGFPSHIKQEKFTPIAFNQSTQGVTSTDIIRFNISTNGFWDPYSAYIKIEVDVSQMGGTKSGSNTGNSAGSQQLDNSASSFINQLIISRGGTEIERIEEYDTISAILNDLNSSYDNRQTRGYEGMNATQSQTYFYNNPKATDPTANSGSTVGFSPFTQLIPGLNSESGISNQFVGNAASNCQRYEFTKLQIDSQLTVDQVIGNATFNGIYDGNITAYSLLNGFNVPFNQSLSACSNEILLTKNFLTNTTYKGKLNQGIYGDKITFCIPLISGLLGVLMPMDSYKYIPMKALQDLIIEFRLNPHAMFTSGYNDNPSSASMTSATSNMTSYGVIQRSWRITKFELNVEMQYFESSIENIILSQLNTDKGIVIHSCSWQLGPRYQINANTAPNGTYQVNLGYESLKNIIWCFMPDDFQNYPFCRKQFRLSANLTQYYLKIGTEYYPPLPITGHAGTPAQYSSLSNDNDANNSEFVVQLYKTFNKFHNIKNNCIINNVNFAVNERAFDPTNIVQPNNGVQWVQFQTSNSLPLLHENRCVGRAVYAMNLETLNQDYSVISGINTVNNRPFELTLKADQTNAFTRNYTMYIFCQYDMLIQLKNTGVNVLGRG